MWWHCIYDWLVIALLCKMPFFLVRTLGFANLIFYMENACQLLAINTSNLLGLLFMNDNICFPVAHGIIKKETTFCMTQLWKVDAVWIDCLNGSGVWPMQQRSSLFLCMSQNWGNGASLEVLSFEYPWRWDLGISFRWKEIRILCRTQEYLVLLLVSLWIRR